MSEGECQTALKGTCNFLKPEMGMKQSGMEPENKNWSFPYAVGIIPSCVHRSSTLSSFFIQFVHRQKLDENMSILRYSLVLSVNFRRE